MFGEELLKHNDATVEKARAANRALNFLRTVAANLDNDGLDDKEFREFMRRSMTGMPMVEYPVKK